MSEAIASHLISFKHNKSGLSFRELLGLSVCEQAYSMQRTSPSKMAEQSHDVYFQI